MQHAIALTFDDGPDPRWTPQVLRTLGEESTRATFFVISERVQRHANVVRQTLLQGHDVQLHCHRHISHAQLSERQIERDTQEALAVLARVGVRPSCWRTPWGVRTAATERVARRNGLRLIDWEIDTHDWRGDPPFTMLVRARAELAGGRSILMHDGIGPGALRHDCQNTVEVLAPLIELARQDDLIIGPLTRPRAARGLARSRAGTVAASAVGWGA